MTSWSKHNDQQQQATKMSKLYTPEAINFQQMRQQNEILQSRKQEIKSKVTRI